MGIASLHPSYGLRCRVDDLSAVAQRAKADPVFQRPLMESISCGVLDTPPEPVIGLAKGETRWRGMTVRAQ